MLEFMDMGRFDEEFVALVTKRKRWKWGIGRYGSDEARIGKKTRCGMIWFGRGRGMVGISG